MKRVLAAIGEEGELLKRHAFFVRIDREPLETLMPILAYNTGFWNLAFQDVLKILDDSVQSPELKRYSRKHREEDANHHIWFLQDMKTLGYPWDSRVYSFFEDRNIPTRIHTYKILSELFALRDDRQRVAFLMVLESPGHAFFGKMCEYMERQGISEKMRYFGRGHIEVEINHTIFEDNSEDYISNIVLEDEIAAESIAMVRRIHALFHGLADEMLLQLDDSQWIATLRATKEERRSEWNKIQTNMSYLAPN